jgi:hypothetical protein
LRNVPWTSTNSFEILDIGVNVRFAGMSRVHHRATAGIANRLRIPPKNAGSVGADFWLPALTTLRELLLGELRIYCSLLGVNCDDVAIAK